MYYKTVAFFFEQVWLHRRNVFIAVGGAADFPVFANFALFQIPWVPELVKTAGAVISGTLVIATMLLMVFYVLKFILAWLVLVVPENYQVRARSRTRFSY